MVTVLRLLKNCKVYDRATSHSHKCTTLGPAMASSHARLAYQSGSWQEADVTFELDHLKRAE